MKECDEFSEAMSSYIDHELDEKSSLQLEAHIEQCPECKQELDRLLHTVKVVNTMPPIELPEGYHDEFMSRLKKEIAEPIQLITKRKETKKSHRHKSKFNKTGLDLFRYKRYSFIAAGFLVTLLVMSSIIGLAGNIFKNEKADEEMVAMRGFQASEATGGTNTLFDISSDIAMETVADEHFVKSYAITIESEDLENTLNVVNSLPGYNSDSNIVHNESTRSAYMTRRVSNDSYDSCKSILRTLGTVTSETESEEKITDSIWDAETLLRARDQEMDRLLALLEKSNSISSMVAIEERIDTVEGERENVKGVLRMHNNKSGNPYIYINIVNTNGQDSDIKDSFGNKIRNSFMSSFQICVRIMEWILITFSGVFLPVILLSAIGFCVYFIHHKTKRRDRNV